MHTITPELRRISRPNGSLDQIANAARRRIEVSDEELGEVRKRRGALVAVLDRTFVGGRTYVNGSIAHGDALTPLTDVDLGVVVPDLNHEYGPGKRGPRSLMDVAAHAIRTGLRAEYGDLGVEVEGRKRSILVRFRDPVAPGRPDFTADVIIAIDNPIGAGLYIPRFQSWDRSDPERHTELIAAANLATSSHFARVVRLLKHWNRKNGNPLCSWNIKALALGCIITPTGPIQGLYDWFRYAIDDLTQQETPDPAGVATKPIKLNGSRTEVLRRLRRSLERLEKAVGLEAAGYGTLAHDQLAKFFNDPEMLAPPEPLAVLLEEARRVAAEGHADSVRLGSPALLTGTGQWMGRDRGNVRSWGA